jgi:hypothetical protein
VAAADGSQLCVQVVVVSHSRVRGFVAAADGSHLCVQVVVVSHSRVSGICGYS